MCSVWCHEQQVTEFSSVLPSAVQALLPGPPGSGRRAVTGWATASHLAFLGLSGLTWAQQLKAALPDTAGADRRKREAGRSAPRHVPFSRWRGRASHGPVDARVSLAGADHMATAAANRWCSRFMFHWPELVTWPQLPPIAGAHASFPVAAPTATQQRAGFC